MNQNHPLRDKDLVLPVGFFNRLIADIPPDTWIRLLQEEPTLKRFLLEGFSGRLHKLPRLLRQPQLQVRLRRLLQTEPSILEAVLNVWAQEQLPVMAFLEMLDHSFVAENWENLRNFLGPERFFAGLYLLNYLDNPDFRKRIGEDFWSDRVIDAEVTELLLPLRTLWKDLVREFPEAQTWLEEISPPTETESQTPPESSDAELRRNWRREEERRHKVEGKLAKIQEEAEQLREEINRYRQENDALRRQVTDWEQTFDHRIGEVMDQERMRRFKRYQSVGPSDESSLEKVRNRLDALLKNAERAFELQRQADEQYGLVSEVRQQLLQVELYLREIERIYSDSLVVHAEVSKVREALLQEKKRLLALPGIGRLFRKEPELISQEDFRQKIRLLEPIPENLPKVLELQKTVHRLDSLGLFENMQSLQEEVAQKKRQIFEILYARFQPEPEFQAAASRQFQNLEDFVQSGQSKKYDLYVDGYNILLKGQGEKKTGPVLSLSTLREQFIQAVSRKSSLFQKVYLVFDGTWSSKDRYENLELIYTDKNRGVTADMVIIRALDKRKDKRAILITADEGIIRAVGKKIYALIDPYHFFTFIFDIDFPIFSKS